MLSMAVKLLCEDIQEHRICSYKQRLKPMIRLKLMLHLYD